VENQEDALLKAAVNNLELYFNAKQGYPEGDPIVMCLKAVIKQLFDLKRNRVVWLCDESVTGSVLNITEIIVLDLEQWLDRWFELFQTHQAFKDTKSARNVEKSVFHYLLSLGMVQKTQVKWVYKDS